jgi:carbamoyl-phosphate synthase small subunit
MTPQRLTERGIDVHLVPASITFEEIQALGVDGVFFSNGPGDPATADDQVELLRSVLDAAHAVLRHLLRQPAARPCVGLRHL